MFLWRLCISILFCLSAVFALNGCAIKSKPIIWVDNNVNFSEYNAFEIPPVFNATDRPLAESILNTLTTHLRTRFRERQLMISEAPEISSGILVVKSEVVVYVGYQSVDRARSTYGPESGGEAQCTLRTRLVDKVTNRVVATITAVDVISAGGMYPIPYGFPIVYRDSEEKILERVVNKTAEEVFKLLDL